VYLAIWRVIDIYGMWHVQASSFGIAPTLFVANASQKPQIKISLERSMFRCWPSSASHVRQDFVSRG
jgi:hypothetical protein